MCSRPCTGVFSEPAYGLKVSFGYVYKTRLLMYKATMLHIRRLTLDSGDMYKTCRQPNIKDSSVA